MSDQKNRVVRRRAPQGQPSESAERPPENLGSALDLLNQRLQEVERRLQPYGVAAHVRLPDDDDLENDIVARLCFEKQGSRWRLFRVLENVFRGERVEDEPLLSASRSVRVAAAAVLPELVEAVKANAAREAAVVREALDSVDAVLRELPPSNEPMPPELPDFDDDCPF